MAKSMSILDAIMNNPDNVQVTCKTCNLMFVGVTQIIDHLDTH